MDNYAKEKQAVLFYAQRAYREGLFAATSGNLSVYHAGDGVMVITPSALDYEAMREEDLVVMTLAGQVTEGQRPPSSEWRMHAEIYQSRPQTGAVVHTHSPYATAFAVNATGIPVVLIEMVGFIGGDVPLAGFAVPGTPTVGQKAAEKLQTRNACLLQNHGVVAVGESLESAHRCAVYVEDAAKICQLARQNGKLRIIPPKTVQFMLDRKRKAAPSDSKQT